MDQAKELALFLGFTATTGLAAMPLHDQAHKVLKTQHGRVLKQLDEIIPRRNAKYWCMRDCVYDQVLHHSPEPTFIQAYATCQKPDRCDLRDPIYIHFPHKEETQTSSGAKSSSKAGQTDGQQPIKDFVGRVAGGFRRGVSNGAKRAKDTLSKSVGIVENVQRKNGGGGSGGMKGFTGPVGIPRPGFVIR
ncbi:MAG: hypothetical protein M1816_008204 [Peltula sp. TS41687]|nr:MAG: hypothetical protein M1816_008204 [Peltula sp. TS41687]